MQSLLDEHKQLIPENLYLKLSKLNLEQYNEKNKRIYEVKYLTSFHRRMSENTYRTNLKMQKTLLKLDKDEYEGIKDKIKTNGYYLTCCSMIDTENFNVGNSEICYNNFCEDCESDTYGEVFVENCSVILSIEESK